MGQHSMKTFLNVIGALALIASVLVFIGSQSAVHEILAAISLLLGCTCAGLARMIEGQDKANTQLALVVKGLAATVQTLQPSSSPAPNAAKVAPPVPGMERYFISDGTRAVGPYEADKVQALLAKGTITKDTDILKEGMSEWQKLGAVFEI